MKNALILKGLSCASCATKIETEVKQLEEVRFASLDFITKKLTFDADTATAPALLRQKIEGIIGRIEPDVKVMAAEGADTLKEEEEETSQKAQIGRLIIGGALFAAAMLLPLPALLELALFVVSYLVVGAAWSGGRSRAWRAARYLPSISS